MNKKIKTLLVFLGIISLLAVGLAAWVYFSAQAEITKYAQRQAKLKKQNTYLQEKFDATQKETHYWQKKSESVTTALNRVNKEHTLLQSQYFSLLEQKDSLVKNNENLSEQLERLNELYSEEQKEVKIDTSDKFLSSLLEEKATLEVEIERLEDKISSQEAHLEDMEKQTKPALEKVERLQKEKQILEEKLGAAQKVSDVLSNDLLQERKKSFALGEELDKTEGRLGDIMLERDKLAEQLTKMKQALEQRLSELNSTKRVLESAVEGAKQVVRKTEPASIQLPPIVVRAEQEAEQEALSQPIKLSKARIVREETAEFAGRIITVNDKHRFVVINLGRDDGLKKGMSFDVYRQDKKVGKLEVIETRKNIAACDVKEMSVKRLKIDDTVLR